MISFLLLFTFFNSGTSTKRFFNPRYNKLRVRNDDSTVCNMCINLMTGISGMINDGIDQDEIQTKNDRLAKENVQLKEQILLYQQIDSKMQTENNQLKTKIQEQEKQFKNDLDKKN